jgi:hypothetical protein
MTRACSPANWTLPQIEIPKLSANELGIKTAGAVELAESLLRDRRSSKRYPITLELEYKLRNSGCSLDKGQPNKIVRHCNGQISASCSLPTAHTSSQTTHAPRGGRAARRNRSISRLPTEVLRRFNLDLDDLRSRLDWLADTDWLPKNNCPRSKTLKRAYKA